jgi:uncharacterized protein involved in type VI secretion and phage assembly
MDDPPPGKGVGRGRFFSAKEMNMQQADKSRFFGKRENESLLDAQYRWFAHLGYPEGGINQRWAMLLRDLGYAEPFPESQRMFFANETGRPSAYGEAEKAFYQGVRAPRPEEPPPVGPSPASLWDRVKQFMFG